MGLSLKQIVYNLEDYGGSGGLVSTSKAGSSEELVYSVVYTNSGTKDTEQIVEDLASYDANKINIFDNNILDGYPGIKKIGIQAPAGTKFTFSQSDTPNEGEYLMVGRTGIYELNDDIEIKSLRFQHPKSYILNKELSLELQTQGTTQMKSARDEFLQKVAELTRQAGTVPDRTETGSTYWEEYNKAHQTYVNAYKSGLSLYLKGKAGVYVDGSEDDLYNIIIDFTYGEGSN